MIDSGCNSHLLPIPAGGLPVLFTTFPTLAPNATGERFTYTLRSGGGVAALQPPVLCISNNAGNAFHIRLNWDLYPYEFIHTKYLQFSLCFDDVVDLIAAQTAGTILGLVGSQSLLTFVNTVTILRAALPGVAIGERKRHALLGRSLIGPAGRQMRFVHGLTIITADETLLFADDSAIITILDNCTNAIMANPFIGLRLFNDLEDDYLAEIPHNEEKLEL
jgi:hypothetical protein